eukprot:10670919-Alexandrium_andersonii.AAC.1
MCIRDSYQVWLSRTLDREAAEYWKMLQRKADRQMKAREVAQSLSDQSSPRFQIQMGIFETSQKTFLPIETLIKHLVKAHSLPSDGDVVSKGF